MAEPDISVASRMRLGRIAIFRPQSLLGLAIGVGGGALQSILLATSLMHGLIWGAVFGGAFGFFFFCRATSPGAGLIWGSPPLCFCGSSDPRGFCLCAAPTIPWACWTRRGRIFPNSSLSRFAWGCQSESRWEPGKCFIREDRTPSSVGDVRLWLGGWRARSLFSSLANGSALAITFHFSP